MGRTERKYMAHFIDSSFSYTPNDDSAVAPTWYRLGEDLEEYYVEMNAAAEVIQNFRGDDIVIHEGYAPSSEVDSFYLYHDDDLFPALRRAAIGRTYGEGLYTLALEVCMWINRNDGYWARMYPVYIIPESYGGDTSGVQIPFNIMFLNTFNKVGTFVPDGNGSGTFWEDVSI